MAVDVTIPGLGESIAEVRLAEWLKPDGAEVKRDENLAVMDSEKATVDLPAPEGGRLKILQPAGGMVKVGQIVAQIEPAGDASMSNREKPPDAAGADSPISAAPAAPPKPAPPATETKAVGKKKAPPRAAPPVETAAPPEKAAPAPNETRPPLEKKPAEGAGAAAGRREETVPMTMLRRTAARRLVEAKQQMAMLTTFNEADLGTIQSLRKELQESFEKRHRVKLGFMPFFVKAAIDALKRFPLLNAGIRGDEIVLHRYFDIGVAIAGERGLVVPVLRNADRMSFAEIEQAIGDFAARAGEAKLKPGELEGGTFTITNGGVFGSLLSTPIINPPQTGILGMHAIQDRPVARDGLVVIRPMMYLALTYDHRLVDGRDAVLFLRRVKETIENPVRTLIEA